MTIKFLLYDWAGLNAALFLFINQNTPTLLTPVTWILSNVLGNYWTAPLAVLGLWAWGRQVKSTSNNRRTFAIKHQLVSFIVALALAMVIATIAKLLLDFPRPPAIYGDLVHLIGPSERHYSLPSGHSVYAALLASALWPLVKSRLRFVLILYVVLVGWSRIASGLHFPADVLAGWITGLCCLALAHGLVKKFCKPMSF